MSRREEEEEEVTTAVYMAAIARAEEEEEGKEVLTAKMSTNKEGNVKSLENNRLRRLSIELLKNTTMVETPGITPLSSEKTSGPNLLGCGSSYCTPMHRRS